VHGVQAHAAVAGPEHARRGLRGGCAAGRLCLGGTVRTRGRGRRLPSRFHGAAFYHAVSGETTAAFFTKREQYRANQAWADSFAPESPNCCDSVIT
jgi:hypothetical protein